MNRFVMAAIAVSFLASAAPVTAQSRFDKRATELEQRIDDGVRNGSLSDTQASLLRAQVQSTRQLQDRYLFEGMAAWQRRDLDLRFNRVSDNLLQVEAGRSE
jgi:hypothetical protein